MNLMRRSQNLWKRSAIVLSGSISCPPCGAQVTCRMLSKQKDSKFEANGQKVSIETNQKPAPLYEESLIDELVSIQDVYRYAVTQYNKNDLSYGHSTNSAFEDASFLIMHELYLPFEDPITHWSSSKLTRKERKHLLDLIHTRITTKKPTPYLVQGCYQQGLYFYVDERVLIPRSYLGEIMLSKSLNVVGSNSDLNAAYEKEEAARVAAMPSALFRDYDYDEYFGGLIEPPESDLDVLKDDSSVNNRPPVTEPQSIPNSSGVSSSPSSNSALFKRNPPPAQYLIDSDRIFSVLDLCTGSGCLAILAAKAFPLAEEIDAVDIAKDALEVAYANVQQHRLGDFITLHKGDLYDPLQNVEVAEGTYDLILSNPPYVSEEGMEELPEEYRHEPTLALHAQDGGIEIIRRILLRAHDHLNDGGGLLCEVGQCREQLMDEFPLLFGEEDEVVGEFSTRPPTAAAAEREEQGEGVIRYRHSDGQVTNKTKVHWLGTENSANEVFYVQKEYLTKKYLKKK